jgi:hypothetical protein
MRRRPPKHTANLLAPRGKRHKKHIYKSSDAASDVLIRSIGFEIYKTSLLYMVLFCVWIFATGAAVFAATGGGGFAPAPTPTPTSSPTPTPTPTPAPTPTPTPTPTPAPVPRVVCEPRSALPAAFVIFLVVPAVLNALFGYFSTSESKLCVAAAALSTMVAFYYYCGASAICDRPWVYAGLLALAFAALGWWVRQSFFGGFFGLFQTPSSLLAWAGVYACVAVPLLVYCTESDYCKKATIGVILAMSFVVAPAVLNYYFGLFDDNWSKFWIATAAAAVAAVVFLYCDERRWCDYGAEVRTAVVAALFALLAALYMYIQHRLTLFRGLDVWTKTGCVVFVIGVLLAALSCEDRQQSGLVGSVMIAAGAAALVMPGSLMDRLKALWKGLYETVKRGAKAYMYLWGAKQLLVVLASAAPLYAQYAQYAAAQRDAPPAPQYAQRQQAAAAQMDAPPAPQYAQRQQAAAAQRDAPPAAGGGGEADAAAARYDGGWDGDWNGGGYDGGRYDGGRYYGGWDGGGGGYDYGGDWYDGGDGGGDDGGGGGDGADLWQKRRSEEAENGDFAQALFADLNMNASNAAAAGMLRSSALIPAPRLENYQPRLRGYSGVLENYQPYYQPAPSLRGYDFEQQRLPAPPVPSVFAGLITQIFYIAGKFLRLAPKAANSARAAKAAKAGAPVSVRMKINKAAERLAVQSGALLSMAHVSRRVFDD